MTVLLSTILTLSVLGILAAVILYFVAQKFKVEEDPRIDEVEKMLPGANCGGCGFAGCRAMAEAMVLRDDISALYCPVGGAECMKSMANYLGKVAPEKEPTVATVSFVYLYIGCSLDRYYDRHTGKIYHMERLGF